MRMKLSVLKRLGLGALFATCFAGLAWAQGAAQFDGQYTGELRLARTFSGDCTEPPFGALYPLTVAGGEVRFPICRASPQRSAARSDRTASSAPPPARERVPCR